MCLSSAHDLLTGKYFFSLSGVSVLEKSKLLAGLGILVGQVMQTCGQIGGTPKCVWIRFQKWISISGSDPEMEIHFWIGIDKAQRIYKLVDPEVEIYFWINPEMEIYFWIRSRNGNPFLDRIQK